MRFLPTFKPSNVQLANGTRVFNHFRTLSRLALAFSTSYALFRVPRTRFQQLTHSLQRKISPNPNRINHPRTLSQKRRVWVPRPQLCHPDRSTLRLRFCHSERSEEPAFLRGRTLNVQQDDANPCNPLHNPCISVQKGCFSVQYAVTSCRKFQFVHDVRMFRLPTFQTGFRYNEG